MPEFAIGPLNYPSPEAELVTRCARKTLGALGRARVDDLLHGPLDWKRVLELAGRHGVWQLLYQNCTATAGQRVPAEVREALKKSVGGTARGNLLLSAELARVLAAFEKAGVRAIAFKGPTLTALAYGNLSLRPFGDLDLLVHQTDVPTATRTLEELGYPKWDVLPRLREAHLKSESEDTFIHPDGNRVVDLHWAITRSYFSFPLRFDELWPRSGRVRVGAVEAACPGTEDLLLILAVHGAKHAWERLCWVTDMAELIQASPDIVWAEVASQADALGCRRMLDLALLLAAEVLDAPVPPVVRAAARRNNAAVKIFNEVVGTFFAEGDGVRGHVSLSRFHLRVRERRRDRVQYCLYGLRPNVRDWAFVKLPKQLQFMYYLVRPIRLAGRAAGK